MRTLTTILFLTCLCFIGCNRDDGGWQGNDPTFDPAPDPDGKLTTPEKDLPRPSSDPVPVCGGEGQACCVVAEFLDGCSGTLFCTDGICLPLPGGDDGGTVVTGGDDGGTQGGDDGGVTTGGGDDGGTVTPPGNDGGSDGDEDECLDPDKGKGDDLHPHGQHRGRIHFCSKKAVIIHAVVR